MKEHTLLQTLSMCIFWTVCHAFIPKHIECIDETVVSAGEVPDTLKAGDVVFSIAELIAIGENCQAIDFIAIEGGNVTLKHDLSKFCEGKAMSCDMTCGHNVQDQIQNAIRWSINRTLEYNISAQSAMYTAEVQEMTPFGTHVGLNHSIQVDFKDCIGSGLSAGQELKLVTNATVPFRWRAETNFNSLTVNGTIDYETNHEFLLQLSIEYPDIHATTTTTIKVTVLDIDDNDPRFNISGVDARYVATIKEGNNVNDALHTEPPIFAYDPDFGINQTLEYSITEQEERGLFVIDPQTGAMSVTRVLDREIKASYRVVIKAAQTDKPTKAASALVMVTVLDADDNLPEFKPEDYTEEVTEHAASGTQVALLSVYDPDEGDNSNFTCVLFNESLPLVVEDVADGCLVLVKDSEKFDREAFPNGTITFQVGAMATLRQQLGDNNASVNVHLRDINDNSPLFTEQKYSFSLTNISKGSVIGLISATDPDKGGNGRVTYMLTSSIVEKEGCDGSREVTLPFSLHNVSGDVYKTSETPSCSIYRTNIQACDNPDKETDRRCSLAQLTVTYTEASGVQNLSQLMEVEENSPIGSYIQSLVCNGRSYTCDSSEFEVDTLGFIKTAAVLDREHTSNYNFQVEVQDQTDTVTCNVNITVNVLDVNDNAPEFSNSSYTFNLPGNPEDGQLIGAVKADDKDEGANAEITYLFHNKAESRFNLNGTTGEISIKSATMVATCDVISLAVIARDSGIPSLEAFAQVYIVCHDDNTTVPVSTPLAKEEVEKRKEALEREISQILNMSVQISAIHESGDSTTERSRILLSPTDPTVHHQQLLESVVRHFEAIRSLLYGPSVQAPDTGTSGKEFGAAEIALIAMGVVILIGTVIAIVIIHRQFNSQKRYKQLYESLTRNSSLYESQEIKMKMDDETSDYNGSVRSQDLGSSDSPRTPALTISAINPGFINDDVNVANQTNVKTPVDPATNTTVKEVIESLERLSDRLEKENDSQLLNDLEPSTTSDDVPLVEQANTADQVYENVDTAPVVHANFTLDDPSESVDVDRDRFRQARNSLEIPASESIALTEMNVEAEINRVDLDSDDTELQEEEPNPDYDVKQVRFSGEVLDADENVLQPLKQDKATGNSATRQEEAAEKEPTADTMEGPAAGEDATGWLEEEIDSPVNTVLESDTGKDFFFSEEVLTHL